MKNIKVLIVDDSSNIRKLVGVILRKDGYEFDEAISGTEALAKIALYRPDIVILDLVIPGIDGYGVCESIKSNEETRGTKVLVLTSESSREARDKAYEAGADQFMTKPFEPDELRLMTKGLLNK